MGESKLKQGRVSGTVEMLKPLIIRFSEEIGFGAFARHTQLSGPNFEQFHINPTPASNERIGIVELQQLPNTRVLLSFNYYPLPDTADDKVAEQHQRFNKFVDLLTLRLVQLGFIELPEQPKGPIGFVPKAGSDM